MPPNIWSLEKGAAGNSNKTFENASRTAVSELRERFEDRKMTKSTKRIKRPDVLASSPYNERIHSRAPVVTN
jgi:hypothetical protein